MRRIFDALPGLYLAMTPELVLVGATEAYLQALGLTREQLVGRRLFDVLPDVPVDDDNAPIRTLRASLAHVMETRQSHSMGLTRYAAARSGEPAGERFWEPTNTPVLGDDGEVAFIVHHTVEVSPRARAEHVLALLFDGPAAVALLTGEDLVVTLANPAVLRMWGKTSAILGKPLGEVLPSIVEHGFIDLLRGVFRSGTPFRAEQMLARLERDGVMTDAYFDFIYVPSRGARGRIEGIFVFAYEVTALVTARAEAQAANHLKDEFLSTLSHELRTPLTSILGWAALLRDSPDDPELRGQGISTILTNARAQARIVEDVLDVSRITSGRMVLQLEEVDVDAAVADALEALAPAARDKRIVVSAEVDPSVGKILADASRFQQILWNLLGNAVKFTPREGAVALTVTRQEAMVEVKVRDNGIGIAEEDLGRVFERFRQLHTGSTRKYGGLGLGLSIARQLAELHGGTLEAASNGPGKGAVFTLRVPA